MTQLNTPIRFALPLLLLGLSACADSRNGANTKGANEGTGGTQATGGTSAADASIATGGAFSTPGAGPEGNRRNVADRVVELVDEDTGAPRYCVPAATAEESHRADNGAWEARRQAATLANLPSRRAENLTDFAVGVIGQLGMGVCAD